MKSRAFCRHRHYWNSDSETCPTCGEVDISQTDIRFDWDEMDWFDWTADMIKALTKAVKGDAPRKSDCRKLINLILTASAAASEWNGKEILPWKEIKQVLDKVDPDGDIQESLRKQWKKEVQNLEKINGCVAQD